MGRTEGYVPFLVFALFSLCQDISDDASYNQEEAKKVADVMIAQSREIEDSQQDNP